MDTGALLLVIPLIILAAFSAFSIMRRSRDQQAHDQVISALQMNLRKSQEQAQITGKRLLQLANSTFDAIIAVDDRRQVTVINANAEAMFNANEPLVGSTLISVTRHHQLDGMVEKAVQSKDVIEDQLEIQGRTYKIRITYIDSAAVVLAFQDVTDLLRLTRARRDMVANISHELRTPISSIRLIVDTLSQNMGRNPERDAQKLAKIDRETESLQYLVEELHDLSMIESGRAIMRMVERPLNDIVRDAVNRMNTQIEQKKIELTNQIPDSIRVLADPDQTRRVFTNLISNAVKFTASGGTIIFKAGVNNNMVRVEVTDSGSGIPPAERERIFERFYQVDNARNGHVQGSGLGLSIAKHIVEAQGGKIWAEGADPQGTRMCFTLPVAAAE